jgi:hypothetical protein
LLLAFTQFFKRRWAAAGHVDFAFANPHLFKDGFHDCPLPVNVHFRPLLIEIPGFKDHFPDGNLKPIKAPAKASRKPRRK